MSFGKRSTSAPAATAAAGARVIPSEMWAGQAAQTLRALGLEPDDETNLIPDRQSLEERLQHGRLALEARTLKVNADVALRVRGGVVRPFFLIPEDCWNGPRGDFLMQRLDLYPFEDWNVAFLPADMRTAVALDAPPHPDGPIAAFEKSAADFLAKEQNKLREAHALATATRDFTAFAETREQIRSRIKSLAAFFAAQLTEAWKRKGPPGAL